MLVQTPLSATDLKKIFLRLVWVAICPGSPMIVPGSVPGEEH